MDNKYEKLIQNILDWGYAINQGDGKIANRKYKTILVLVKRVNEKEPINLIIKELLSYSEIPINYWAFVIALKNCVFEDNAIRGLTDLAKNTTTGPIGALARIGVLEWEEKSKTHK